MRKDLPIWALAAASVLSSAVTGQQQDVQVIAPGVDSFAIQGTFRTRVENRDFDTLASARTYTARLRVNLDVQVDDFIGAYFEFQNFGTAGEATTSDVHQGYATLTDLFNLFDLQVGRFEMSYGHQRMVSPLDWSNSGRAWDGFRAQHIAPDYNLDLFITKPVAGQGAQGPASQVFSGLYYERQIGDVDTDVYLFRRENGTRDDFTLGFLVEGEVEGISWSGEAAQQFGDADVNVDANGTAIAVRADGKVWGDLKVGLGYELATGDDDPTDADNDAFVPLFDFAHKYHGHADLVTWTNLSDIILRTAGPIDDNWNWYGDLHLLSLAEDDATGESFLGTEVDLGVKGNIGQNAFFWGGVSQFVAGDTAAVGAIGNQDVSWIFAQVGIRF